ncbi:hypothetical protein M404DRAFT_1001189 [Pisolithus tinctorius Marx 270]|uniref:Exosome complex exonuclease RRP44 S1 domain-containing protein n=1 Tax=Pisolithus tinctorius Marx 270 TaxID=870435 RepID=A0A0C3P7S1_PISTI|nr:hypothetical protein M404DRAFT_1001189 [Pisolithus tinctorius Marx 270]
MDVLNQRHRMAQMVGRASVEFYVGLALRKRGEVLAKTGNVRGVAEEVFVVRTFRNGLGVFVFELGSEGPVMFKQDVRLDAENYTVTLPEVTIALFDKVKVRIDVEKDKNTQRGRVKMTLVSPVDSSGL